MTVDAITRSLATTCLGRRSYNESNIYRGDQLEAWVARLEFGQTVPTSFTLTVGTAANQNDGTLSLAAATGETVVLYQGHVLWFLNAGTPTPAVILTTTTVTDVAGAVPIRPLANAIAANETCLTYAMVPILSLESGWIPQSTGTFAESRNRQQDYFTVKAIYQRSANAAADGTAIRNDVGLAILENNALTNNIFYCESRRPVFDGYGVGYNAYKWVAFIENNSPTSPVGDHSKVSLTLQISGSFTRYTPLGSTLADIKALCPEDAYLQELSDLVC